MTGSRRAVTGWVNFQVESSKQFLRDVSATLLHAAPIVLLVMGPLTVGLIAFIALAPLMAPSFGLAQGAALVFGQSAMIALPLFLARKLVLPDSVLVWRAGLPIRWQTQLAADAWAALVLLLPLFAACLLSALVWFWQWPQWLRPIWGVSVLCLLAAMLGAWGWGVLILTMRGRTLPLFTLPVKTLSRTGAGATVRPGWRQWRILRDLTLRPVWRNSSLVWKVLHPLLIVIAAGCIGVFALIEPTFVPWRAAFSLVVATLVVGLTLWRDSVMQANLAHLTKEIPAWPVSFSRLVIFVRLWAVWPGSALALFFLAAYLNRAPWSAVAAAFFSLMFAGPYAMLALSKAATPGRAGFSCCLWAMLIISGYFL